MDSKKKSDERIVGPLEERLPLTGAAATIAPSAVLLHLHLMPTEIAPSSDLEGIDPRVAATDKEAAVPLKPSTYIVPIDPVLPPPFSKREP